VALLGVARKLIKRERLFHLFFIEMSGAEPGAVKFSFCGRNSAAAPASKLSTM